MPRQPSPLSIEYVLLGFLDQEAIHGYDLFKRLNSLEAIGMVWTIKQSQLYALLEKLEEENLVQSTIIPGESRPNRKQYSITSLGRQTFIAWRNSPVEHGREMRIEFLAKLFFSMKAGSETTLELVDEQRSRCIEWLNHLDYSLGNLDQQQIFEKSVLQYRITQMQATINWLTSLHDEMIKNKKLVGYSKG